MVENVILKDWRTALIVNTNMENKTMHETYGDCSEHLCCFSCGFCVECGDCNKYGCGSENKPKTK